MSCHVMQMQHYSAHVQKVRIVARHMQVKNYQATVKFSKCSKVHGHQA